MVSKVDMAWPSLTLQSLPFLPSPTPSVHTSLLLLQGQSKLVPTLASLNMLLFYL